MAEGIAITSILHTDDHSHIEPVRYGHGSDFFRWMVLPHAPGKNFVARLGGAVKQFAQRHGFVKRAYSIPRNEFARRRPSLLFMRTLDGTLSLKFGRSALNGFTRQLVSVLDDPKDAPQAFMEDATDLARRFAEKVRASRSAW
jgi:cholesterol oxidase